MKSTIPPYLMDVVGEMTTVLINRYRSPLTGIMGFVELLKKNKYHCDDHYLETINNGLKEIFGLLDEMEELNQAPIVQIQTLYLNELVKDIISNYPGLDRKRIHLYDDTVPVKLDADYHLLSRIISALLDNSLEHDHKEKSDVLIEFNEDNNLSITNFGPPIPGDFLEKMFYPFCSTKAHNMGLGLTRASLFAQAQGLMIELISNNEIDGIRFNIKKTE